ncbi:MAG: hypothetical protein WEE64_00850 [Dehalococcoidia bacterium]
MTGQDPSWFEFTVYDTEGDGIEIPKLARLLEDISAAFYSIARAKIGAAGSRAGRRTIAEETIGGARVLRVLPGSARIELAPPVSAAQAQLPLLDEPTADDVAFEFYEEIRNIEAGRPAAEERWDVRRRLRTVIEHAAEIGSRAEIKYRPLVRGPNFPQDAVLITSFRTKELPSEAPVRRSNRSRRVSGHAYMVDVEPGRQRLRLKLPDGRDLTVEVDGALAARIPAALDHVVEIDVQEEFEGEVSTSRMARNIDILASSGRGSDKPPKSVEELEREQNLPAERPDYVSLATTIWETEDEVTQFEEHIRQVRQASTA